MMQEDIAQWGKGGLPDCVGKSRRRPREGGGG